MGGCFAFWYDKLGGSIGGRSCRSCGSDGWNERRFRIRREKDSHPYWSILKQKFEKNILFN